MVKANDQQILLVEHDDGVYAFSNRCAHMNLPIEGKTPFINAKVEEGCLECPWHGSNFSLETGEPQGEWCPRMPPIPIMNKKLGNERSSQPKFDCRLQDDGTIEVYA